MRYEVDLRERKTGSSVITIFVTWNVNKAWEIVDWYNRNHLDDYNPNTCIEDYIDEDKDGFFADCYYIDSTMEAGSIKTIPMSELQRRTK